MEEDLHVQNLHMKEVWMSAFSSLHHVSAVETKPAEALQLAIMYSLHSLDGWLGNTLKCSPSKDQQSRLLTRTHNTLCLLIITSGSEPGCILWDSFFNDLILPEDVRRTARVHGLTSLYVCEDDMSTLNTLAFSTARTDLVFLRKIQLSHFSDLKHWSQLSGLRVYSPASCARPW